MSAQLNSGSAEVSSHAEASGNAEAPGRTAAERFLQTLADRGVEHLYVGAGTDTAPIIEAYSRQPQSGLDFPKPVLAAHENLAVGMAHGYYMVSGRPQAVMLHVSVGAANAVCGLMNAARSQVPMFFTAGRTPLFESGALGARDSTIHWGQEMFDQAGMVREFMKWDYELRDGRNLVDVVDRGLSMAMAPPRGPVYLTLPREVLGGAADDGPMPAMSAVPSLPHPMPQDVRKLAAALAVARFPVIVCTASGADPQTLPLLTQLADRFGIAVVEASPRFVNFPDKHPLHLGFDPDRVLPQADAMLFLECDVPWIPSRGGPAPDAFVAHAGVDPSFSRYPVRTFRSDLSLTTDVAALLTALVGELAAAGADRTQAARRAHGVELASTLRQAVQAGARAEDERGGPISKAYLSRCLDQVRDRDALVVNEYPLLRPQMSFEQPGGYFLVSTAGGLGWGLPAALGAQQAEPDRQVIAALGDGSYFFCNPAACHHAAAMHGLPVLTVIFDNGGWDAVEKAALSMYPDSHAAEAARGGQRVPLSSLHPIPDFTLYAQASGGHGERVDRREALIPALQRAAAFVRKERRQALVHVVGA
ncbi:MAG: thiamine pyrophosphate-requiring protein [Burkholderiaceae bacterium]